MWVEKYRPKRLEDVINQKEVVLRVKQFLRNPATMPHLIFAGPPGTGKTTVAICMANELFGNRWRELTLELNASVTPDTPITIRENSVVKRTNFAELAKEYFTGPNERYAFPRDLEILSLDKDYNVNFMRVSLISRHKVKNIAKIKYEGGEIKASLDHSVMVLNGSGDLIPIRVEDLKIGDLLVTFKTNSDCGDLRSVSISQFKPKLFKELKTGFLPASLVVNLAKGLTSSEVKRFLEHRVDGKRKRISKRLVEKFLQKIDAQRLGQEGKMVYDRLVKLLSSPCSVVLVKDIKIQNFDDYVYDVSIPGVEMFWGGATPILLHNSDERGLPMVRGRVKTFARLGTFGDFPFRLIILDECDQITPDAQTALRRIMEENSKTCRFILICNYSSKIIEPIQSRCAIFRFLNLNKEDVAKYLRFIGEREGFKLTDGGFEVLWEFCGGDLRRAINTLQASAVLSNVITEESVLKVVGRANPRDVLSMLNLALSGRFIEAREKLYEIMVKYGLSGTDIIRQIHREILGINLPEEEKMELINLIGEYDYRLTEGANEDIQLSALLAQLALFKRRGSKE